MSPGRQSKALQRRPFEELVRLVVCFSASLPPNSSGCSRRLTSVGRFVRAFVRQRRDHSGHARLLKNLLGGSKERKMEGRRKGGRRGQRESEIKKREKESSPFGNSAGISFMSSMLGSESLPAGPGVRVCS